MVLEMDLSPLRIQMEVLQVCERRPCSYDYVSRPAWLVGCLSVLNVLMSRWSRPEEAAAMFTSRYLVDWLVNCLCLRFLCLCGQGQ